jgi:hypothetical protein
VRCRKACGSVNSERGVPGSVAFSDACCVFCFCVLAVLRFRALILGTSCCCRSAPACGIACQQQTMVSWTSYRTCSLQTPRSGPAQRKRCSTRGCGTRTHQQSRFLIRGAAECGWKGSAAAAAARRWCGAASMPASRADP